jgi:hypothetical protein
MVLPIWWRGAGLVAPASAGVALLLSEALEPLRQSFTGEGQTHWDWATSFVIAAALCSLIPYIIQRTIAYSIRDAEARKLAGKPYADMTAYQEKWSGRHAFMFIDLKVWPLIFIGIAVAIIANHYLV